MFLIGILILLLTQPSLTLQSETVEETAAVIGVRSLYDEFTIRSTTLLRYLTIRMKVLYPTYNASDPIPSDPVVPPAPVVVFFGGWFVESNRYQWLGERLVKECGIVWVATDTVVSVSGVSMLTSIGGSVFDVLNPTHGLMTLLTKLKDMNVEGVLKGLLDVNRIILGGHSWGGRVVLVGDTQWGGLPSSVVGVFVYAAHAERAFVPGYLPGSMLKLKGSAPLLLMAANRDKVQQSRFPSSSKSAVKAVRRTFDYSVSRCRSCMFIEFDGFNHMSGVYPEDPTVRTAKFDGTCSHDKEAMMEEIHLILSLFVRQHALGDQKAAEELKKHVLDDKNIYIKDAAMKG